MFALSWSLAYFAHVSVWAGVQDGAALEILLFVLYHGRSEVPFFFCEPLRSLSLRSLLSPLCKLGVI